MIQTIAAGDRGLHAIVITGNLERRARQFARVWSAVAVSLFVTLAATVGLPHGPDLEVWERQSQLAMMAIIVIGFLLALRWEGLGGSIMLISATALGVFAALQHGPLVAFLPASAFLIPAVGFLVAWHRTRSFGAILTLGVVLAVILIGGSVAAQAMYAYGFGPAHPQSALPALPDSPVTWMWSGGVTPTGAVVVARVDGAERVALIARNDVGGAIEFPGNEIVNVWRFQLDGLDPATEYDYQFEVDGQLVASRIGRLRTFPAGPASFKIAVGSCARLGSNGKVYEAIRAAEPDVFIVPGDFFYADHIVTADQFSDAFDSTLTAPAQAALLGQVPIAYVWDDHDYGGNDADSTAATRDIARHAYSAFVPHYPLTGSGTINQAFSIGRVRFLMLDNRSARDPKTDPDGPEKTMLGADQIAWLEGQLVAAGSEYPLTVIVTSVPWIGEPRDGADDWGGYAGERQALADFIAANSVGNLLMVAGDAHMIAIDDGTNTDYSTAGNSGFPLLHAAALDRPGSVKGGPYSEGTYPGGGQFGLIEVGDAGTDLITIRLAGFDWTGSPLLEYTFDVSAAESTP
jgi:hypothetical protein